MTWSRVIGRVPRCRSDLRGHRAFARKTKTAFQTALRGMRLSDTPPTVAVFGARSLPQRVFLAATGMGQGAHWRENSVPTYRYGAFGGSVRLTPPAPPRFSERFASEK